MYWGDYLRDTKHLSLEEHGAYLLLIAHYWAHGGLPTDEAGRRNIVGLSGWHSMRKWRSICLAIAPFFDENWRHKRIDAELEKQRIISEKRALAGLKGGATSRGKTNIQRFAIQAFAKQTGGIPQRYITTTESGAESEEVSRAEESAAAMRERLSKRKQWVR
jgi:uncharacterized protein YdaU (DUF1376 family)